ncbi:MAG: alpha/beta hydrolase [Caulobacteraceae bacterium]|nr:alpha/beta hydrolase [Caulobacteraceae bacterium]
MLGACSIFTLLNVAARATCPGVAVALGFAYGRNARNRLDIYAPARCAPQRPVVVFFYGGGWDSGARADYAWVGRSLAAQGYVVVVADYRIHPEVVWPAFLQDAAQAVRWTRDNIAAHGGDPLRLVLMGHSAGAYNAVELAVNRRWLAAVGLEAARDLKGVVGLSGPYDFLPLHSERLKAIFQPEALRPDTQPINNVDGRNPPLLLVTGDQDATVHAGNSDRLAAAVRAAGGEAAVIHYPRLDHARTLGSLIPPLQWLAPVMRDARTFIDAWTGA